MDEQEDSVKIAIRHTTVDPREADWAPLQQFESKWKYRVFFQKRMAAMANSLHLGDLRYFLEDFCGNEGEHWLAEPCDEPKIHTVAGEDAETMLHGNSAYLTDMGWVIAWRLNGMGKLDEDVEFEPGYHPWDSLTIIETRKTQ